MSTEFRIEHDSLGELKVPVKALYGVQTQRAVENWKISGIKEPEVFIRAFVMIKRAAATVNAELGMLSKERAQAIEKAADQILKERKYLDQFVVDVYQAGAGTSFNMNTNEVLANLAAEMAGKKRGDYEFVHPNDHVNMAQSTNDSFPTAIKLATLTQHKDLLKAVELCISSFDKKAKEFDDIITSGRTHLQDAVPVRLGQVFGAFADSLRKEKQRLEDSAKELEFMNIGGTALGTGMNSHPKYPAAMAKELSKLSGLSLSPGKNFIELSQNMSDCAFYSAALRNLALSVTKIANDLRLMSSGPTTGISEIELPAVQPGSSIMPGKVNPVMMEMLNMVCFEVIGHDTTVSYSAQAGQFQLNVMMPVIAYNILMSQSIMANALSICSEKCFSGIKANKDRCETYFHSTMGLATALNTVVGYEKASQVVKKAVAEKKTIAQVVLELGYLTEDELKKYFSRRLTEPGFIEKK